jgi:hypothetical protein
MKVPTTKDLENARCGKKTAKLKKKIMKLDQKIEKENKRRQE